MPGLPESLRYRVRSADRGALLGEGEVVIGRSPYCSMVIEHETLSRLHAAVRIAGDGVEIADLGSSNGTWVNGKRITAPVRVGPQDQIMLGRVDVWIEIMSDPATKATGKFEAVRLTELDLEATMKGDET